LTFIPWQNGKSLTWDVTVTTVLADSCISASANAAGDAAEMGQMDTSAVDFFSDLGCKIGLSSCEAREHYSTILLHESFTVVDDPDLY